MKQETETTNALRIEARARCHKSGLFFKVYGYKVDKQGNVTCIDTEPSVGHHCWEAVKDFDMNYQVTTIQTKRRKKEESISE